MPTHHSSASLKKEIKIGDEKKIPFTESSAESKKSTLVSSQETASIHTLGWIVEHLVDVDGGGWQKGGSTWEG